MENIIFLTAQDIIDIHAMQVSRFKGIYGIRDLGLLKSAVAMPEATFGGEYVHQDCIEMAAAYMFHLIKNHAFIDGNKRTGSLAAVIFLRLNGFSLELTQRQIFSYAYKVAESTLSKEDLAAKLREHIIAMQ